MIKERKIITNNTIENQCELNIIEKELNTLERNFYSECRGRWLFNTDIDRKNFDVIKKKLESGHNGRLVFLGDSFVINKSVPLKELQWAELHGVYEKEPCKGCIQCENRKFYGFYNITY